MNTDHYVMYNILSEIVWWVLSNISLIVGIHPVVSKIKLVVTDSLISQ